MSACRATIGSVFFGPEPPIEDGDARLDRPRSADGVVEAVEAALVRDGLAVQEPADQRDGLAKPVQPFAEAGTEVEPERLVLAGEPAGAQAQDHPPAADVVERRRHLRRETRVAEGVGDDHVPQPRPLCHRGTATTSSSPRASHRASRPRPRGGGRRSRGRRSLPPRPAARLAHLGPARPLHPERRPEPHHAPVTAEAWVRTPRALSRAAPRVAAEPRLPAACDEHVHRAATHGVRDLGQEQPAPPAPAHDDPVDPEAEGRRVIEPHERPEADTSTWMAAARAGSTHRNRGSPRVAQRAASTTDAQGGLSASRLPMHPRSSPSSVSVTKAPARRSGSGSASRAAPSAVPRQCAGRDGHGNPCQAEQAVPLGGWDHDRRRTTGVDGPRVRRSAGRRRDVWTCHGSVLRRWADRAPRRPRGQGGIAPDGSRRHWSGRRRARDSGIDMPPAHSPPRRSVPTILAEPLPEGERPLRGLRPPVPGTARARWDLRRAREP